MLTTTNHDRDKAGLTYVYPVLSRRSGGLSVGININTNNACNWRCIYCQVPDLKRGSAPPVNFDMLGRELRRFLDDVIHGDFYERENIDDELRIIKDIAISGNGEAATSSEFDQVINTLAIIMQEYGLLGDIKCVLISNGSMVNREIVKRGLKKLASINGEVWFKVDSATREGMAMINHVNSNPIATLDRLQASTSLCPTWIQTCFFAWKERPPANREIDAYIKFLDAVESRKIPIEGVMIYGYARDSYQDEAKYISALPESWFQQLAERLNKYDFEIRITP